MSIIFRKNSPDFILMQIKQVYFSGTIPFQQQYSGAVSSAFISGSNSRISGVITTYPTNTT
jgi:hypothetical protein